VPAAAVVALVLLCCQVEVVMLPYWWDGVLVDARYIMLHGEKVVGSWLARGGKELYMANKEQNLQVRGLVGVEEQARAGEVLPLLRF
jgi:hypothetical protein